MLCIYYVPRSIFGATLRDAAAHTFLRGKPTLQGRCHEHRHRLQQHTGPGAPPVVRQPENSKACCTSEMPVTEQSANASVIPRCYSQGAHRSHQPSPGKKAASGMGCISGCQSCSALIGVDNCTDVDHNFLALSPHLGTRVQLPNETLGISSRESCSPRKCPGKDSVRARQMDKGEEMGTKRRPRLLCSGTWREVHSNSFFKWITQTALIPPNAYPELMRP